MVSCRIANVRMESTIRWVIPMLIAMFGVMLLVIAFPQLALWLPAKLGLLIFSEMLKNLNPKRRQTMKLRTFLTVTAAAATLLTMGLPAAHAQAKYKDQYRLSIVLGTAFPWGKGAELWANKVRERTQGRINIKLYPGTSLVQGDQTREFSAIRQGVIDMAVGSTINWLPQVKALNLFSLPFLFPDYAAVDAVVQGQVGQESSKPSTRPGCCHWLGGRTATVKSPTPSTQLPSPKT